MGDLWSDSESRQFMLNRDFLVVQYIKNIKKYMFILPKFVIRQILMLVITNIKTSAVGLKKYFFNV